jgi:ABC-type branched-subunit amino acid transport system ATPase component/ABC-type branched-subunit amino acid transport system permease subunit
MIERQASGPVSESAGAVALGVDEGVGKPGLAVRSELASSSRRLTRWARVPALNGAAVALLAIVAASLFGYSSYHTFVIQTVALYAIAAYGLDIAAGYAGVLSLGQGAAFAVGGYVVGILAAKEGMPFWVALPAALLAGAVLGSAMGAPAVRLGGLSLAMISLGFSLVAADVATSLTGGSEGIVGVVPRVGFGLTETPLGAGPVVILLVVVLWATYVAHATFRRSHLGRTAFATKDDQLGSRALGISTAKVQIVAVMAASSLGALAGGLYAYTNQFVSADITNLNFSILFLIMVVFGGAGNQYGPLIGAAVIGALPLYLSKYTSSDTYIYAGLLLLVVRVRPRGVIGRTAQAVRLPAASLNGTAEGAVSEPNPVGRGMVAGQRRVTSTVPSLECAEVSRQFGGVRALSDVSLSVASGQVVAVVGPNGSGKTTLLNVISGYYPPSGGSVLLNGELIGGESVRRIARAGLGRTFQTPKIFNSLSASEHIALARAEITGSARGPRTEKVLSVSYELLRAVGLDVTSDQRESRDLSHGQRRFLEIAMAIAREPTVLLLDEPATGLSSEEARLLMNAIAEVVGLGFGVLIVEHHLDIVRQISDEVHVLHLGSTLWSGKPDEMTSSAVVRDAYLGRQP